MPSRHGCERHGPATRATSPLTARPHVEVTTAPPARRRSTSSRRSPPRAVSFSAKRRSRTRPTRSPPFRSCSSGSPQRMALLSIDAIATNPTVATAIRDAGADYLLAVKANQPSLRAEIESLFTDADPADLDSTTDHDKGHGRIEQRTVTVARQVDWLDGDRRFPGEVRLPNVATVVKVASRRTQGQMPLRDTLLRLIRRALRLPCRRGRARPPGHREESELGSRCHLRRRSIAPQNRARREKHGSRQTFRHKSRPNRQGQAKHQAQTKTRRLGPQLSRNNPGPSNALTRIRSPAQSTAPQIRQCGWTGPIMTHSVVYPRGVCADCQASRDRNTIYGYLSAVYGLVAWWAAEGRDANSIEPARALRLQRSVPRSCRDPFTAVIRWTADPAKADKRTRSKWSCVMRYALA